jgi:hypothetical protein
MDVTTQLAGGANPMLILIQQGPALAAAIASASSASALFSGILASMKAALISAAGVLGPLAIALAAAGTAYLITKNATEEANEAQGIYNVNVEDAEAKLAAMAGRLDEVNGMLGKVRDRTKDNAREIAVLTGEITKGRGWPTEGDRDGRRAGQGRDAGGPRPTKGAARLGTRPRERLEVGGEAIKRPARQRDPRRATREHPGRERADPSP